MLDDGLMTPTDPADAPINQVLADNLRYFMKTKGLSQAQLGAKAGMGQTTVSLYLNPKNRLGSATGKTKSAKLAEVQRLAEALGVEVWALLRPLNEVEREFYRTMDALIAQRVAPQVAAAPAVQATSNRRAVRR